MLGQSIETTRVEAISEEESSHSLTYGIFVPDLMCNGASGGVGDEELVNIGLVHLYTVSCLYGWDKLSGYASYIYAHGGTVEQVQACIRHLVVFSGYGPCLAAMSAMKKKGAIPHDTPGKISSPCQDLHGNAFALVYHGVEASVRRKVYDADPVLENWIQGHLYGDVYSSPGLTMLQKQYLTVAGLVKSNMMEQLFGHAIAALRFGATEEFLKGIIDIVEHVTREIHGPCIATPEYKKAKRVIDMAIAKRARTRETPESLDSVQIPDPSTVCIPDVP